MALKILIIAENASTSFGGEAMLPLNYFLLLKKQQKPVWLITHANRTSLMKACASHLNDITFVNDSVFIKLLWKFNKRLPPRISQFTIGTLSTLLFQYHAKKIALNLIKDKEVDIIHQPVPVSPKQVSLIYDMGVPTVFGPLNGGMTFPPAFEKRENFFALHFTRWGRRFAEPLQWIFPGKIRAAIVLVANKRTQEALPKNIKSRQITLVENGADLSIWRPRSSFEKKHTRFVYTGRLVDWKAVDVLIKAFAGLGQEVPDADLYIVGDGPLRKELEELSLSLRLDKKVKFLGWKTQNEVSEILQQCDVFVISSLYECGGAVILEAMASALPVIAVDWGGPSDYLDKDNGILIEPRSEAYLIQSFRDSMVKLAINPDLRERLGTQGRKKVEQCFSWESKVEQIQEIYRLATQQEASLINVRQ